MANADDARLPAITLTDPENRAAPPSPAWSPSPASPGARNHVGERGLAALTGAAGGKSAPRDASQAAGRDGRPATPTSLMGRGGEARTPDSSPRRSPNRLMRTLSSNASLSSTVPSNHREENAARNGRPPPPAEIPTPPSTIDPLSQHILKRTSTPMTLPTTAGARPPSAEGGGNREDRGKSEERGAAPAGQSPVRRTDTMDSAQAQRELKKGAKAVSFISRLMGSNNKKRDGGSAGGGEEAAADESGSNEDRPEGNDAEVFAQPLDHVGFSPRHQTPPAYIKVRSKHKKTRDFDRLFLAQELYCRKRRKVERTNSSNKLRRKSSTTPAEPSTVWAMQFSRDGKYLAAAGADGVVRVWAVMSSLDDRQKHERQEAAANEENGVAAHAGHLSAPVFLSQPIREYEGHSATVLDLSWSKNNFLLSSSMDKTVRLWHVSRSECLCTFKHNDFVPSIAFHPKDDRFFLAGSLDCRLRLWSIPDKNVAYTAQVPEMITAVAFTPDGKYAMAGCRNGQCLFYETEGMKYQSQMHVRSSRGQNARGSKITGINAYHDARGDVKLLITSNDSRVRLYNFRDKCLEVKFRGNENNSSQIRASLSDDGKYVVCGSEDRKAYIWSMRPADGDKREKRPLELFEASNNLTTAVCFAPTKSRHLLSKSEDPVYDLCNPPPMTLMSAALQTGSRGSSKPPTEDGSLQATPAEAEAPIEKPKESPAYLSRAGHRAGNIVVTADYSGVIKVFRQDCAWTKRRPDDWDRGSIFNKRSTGRTSRTASIATKASQRSLRDSRMSTSAPTSERILSWRQGIASSASVAETFRKTSSRSVSPRKSLDLRHHPKPHHQPSTSTVPPSASSEWSQATAKLKSTHPLAADVLVDTAKARAAAAGPGGSGSAPDSPRSTTSASGSKQDDNPLMLQGGRSYLFWDTEEWKARSERMRRQHEAAESLPLTPITSREDGGGSSHDEGAGGGVKDGHLAVRPPLSQTRTYVSELSDEHTSASASGAEEDFDDAREEQAMRCRQCGAAAFAAKRSKDGATRLVCADCGTAVT